MNNFKSCIPCVCTSSGCKQVCGEHNIGTQCGATATNTATKTVEHSDAINIQKSLQNQQKQLNTQTKQKTTKSAKSAKFSKIHKTAGGSS